MTLHLKRVEAEEIERALEHRRLVGNEFDIIAAWHATIIKEADAKLAIARENFLVARERWDLLGTRLVAEQISAIKNAEQV